MPATFAPADIQFPRAYTPLLSGITVPEETSHKECDLTVQEAARMAGVDIRTVQNWISRGVLVPSRRAGVAYLSREDIEDILCAVRSHVAPFDWEADSLPKLGKYTQVSPEDYAI